MRCCSTTLTVFILVYLSSCSTTSTQAGEQTDKCAKLTLSTASTSHNKNLDNKVLEYGRTLTSLFYKCEISQVWTKMTAEMKKALRSEEDLTSFRQQINLQLGDENNLVDEKTMMSPPYRVYLRTAAFSKLDKPVNIQWTIDENNKVAGFFIRPAE